VAITGTNDHKAGVMSIIRGCLATGTPYEGLGTTTGNSTNPTGSAVTTTGNDRLVVNLIAKPNTTLNTTPAAGWTEQFELSGSTSFPRSDDLAWHDKVVSSATTEPAEATTASSSRWRMDSLAFLPR
jgi:hypothetical protein